MNSDFRSLGVTTLAFTGVVTFWRGFWTVLDDFVGESLSGHILCAFLGLGIVLWLRISGAQMAKIWPD